MRDYNAQAKAYWGIAALLGWAALLGAIIRVAPLPTPTILQVVVGATLAAAAGLFPIPIPGGKTSVSVGDVFVFMLLLRLGPDAAVIAAAAEAALISLRTSSRWTSWLGSPAMAALAMSAAGIAFTFGQVHLPPIDGSATASSCVLMVTAACVFFVVGTLLMASLIKLKRGEPIQPVRILREHLWLAIAYIASASIAWLLRVSFATLAFATILATLPMVAAMLIVLHGYLRRSVERRT